VWNTATVTGLTTTGTQAVNVTSTGGSGITVNSGPLSEANSISFNFTGGTYVLIFLATAGYTARNVNFTGYAGSFQSTSTVIVYGNFTLSAGMTLVGTTSAMTFGATSGTQLITTNAKTINFPITFDGSLGTTYQLQDNLTVISTRTTTLTRGILDLQSYTLSTGNFDVSNTNVRRIYFGTGQINCTGTGLSVWNGLNYLSFTTTGSRVVNITSTGSTAIQVQSGQLPEADALNFNFTGGTYALTFLATSNHTARNVNFTGFAGTWGITGAGIIYGNLTLSAGMTLTASINAMSFRATSGTQLITTNAKTIDFPLTFNGIGGTFQPQDALTMGANGAVILTNGTLDLNGYTYTVGTTFTTASGIKNLTFNGGTLVISNASATAFNNAIPTNFTTTAGTGTGVISMTAATAKTFVGGGSTFNCTLQNAGAGALTITGSNTFTTISNSVQPTTFTFTAATTTTITNWNINGTLGNLVTIGSATAANHTLSKASGTVSVNYLSISRSTATGGATWEAFVSNGNVNGGGNLGWDFGVVPATGNFLMFF
jgi:hypothetical protein